MPVFSIFCCQRPQVFNCNRDYLRSFKQPPSNLIEFLRISDYRPAHVSGQRLQPYRVGYSRAFVHLTSRHQDSAHSSQTLYSSSKIASKFIKLNQSATLASMNASAARTAKRTGKFFFCCLLFDFDFGCQPRTSTF